MHILDTDTLTHLHAGHPNVAQHLQALSDADVGTTLITKIELLRGRFEYLLKASDGSDLLRAQERLLRTEELLAQIRVVPFDEQSVAVFERFRVHRRFRKVGRADLLVASIALVHNATLVTRNLRHFRQFPRLSVTNWVD